MLCILNIYDLCEVTFGKFNLFKRKTDSRRVFPSAGSLPKCTQWLDESESKESGVQSKEASIMMAATCDTAISSGFWFCHSCSRRGARSFFWVNWKHGTSLGLLQPSICIDFHHWAFCKAGRCPFTWAIFYCVQFISRELNQEEREKIEFKLVLWDGMPAFASRGSQCCAQIWPKYATGNKQSQLRWNKQQLNKYKNFTLWEGCSCE